MGNSPQKNLKKNFLIGDFHTIHYPMGISPKKIYGNPPIFPYGKFPAFLSQKPYGKFPPLFFSMGNSPLFSPHPLGEFFTFLLTPLWEFPTFLLTPLWEFPKKNLEKIFSSGYMDNCSPKNGGAPWGEGAWGDTYPPPMGYMGGRLLIKITYQDCLSRLLVRVLVRVLLVQCAFDFVHSCRQ